MPQKPISGSQPQQCPAAEVDAAARRAGLAPTTSPWASPGIHTATQPASTLNVLQINPTEGRTRREDCSETKRPPVPRAAQPKKHKCQRRGESEGVRPAGGAAFWQEPRVGQLRPVVKLHIHAASLSGSSLRASQGPVVQCGFRNQQHLHWIQLLLQFISRP